MPKRLSSVIGFVVALAVSASTWFYMDQILRAQQVADAMAHDRPRGSLSDLYPRWLGARELLKHGRNPYSPEVTREIQQGYYGRPVDPSRPNDPKDQQGFAYPVYVVFLLAPTVGFKFATVQAGFLWLLLALTAVSVLFWLWILRWSAPLGTVLILTALLLGWLPMVQGIKLQQFTLLVAGMLAGCGVCLAGGWFFSGGVLLALATIKPQLAWPLVLWLLVWAISDWRARRKLVFGFALVMALLLGGGQLLFPSWLPKFIDAIRQYLQYTHSQSVLTLLFGLLAGRLVGVASLLACAVCVWRGRREPATSAVFGRSFALVLALTVLIVPMGALYNQVLLAPAILALVQSAIARDPILPAIRRARDVGALLLVWPWIATVGLSAAYLWLTPGVRERVWHLPLYTSVVLPVFVFGLALLDAWANRVRGLRERAAAE